MQSHVCKVYASLAVTCHLHLWQNDRDLLRAIAVTWGWNGYQNKSRHRKLTLEKKILPPLLQGFEPMTFQSWVQRSNHWAIPAASVCVCIYASCMCERERERVCGSLCLVSNAFKYQYLKDINIGRTEQKCHFVANRLVPAHFLVCRKWNEHSWERGFRRVGRSEGMGCEEGFTNSLFICQS